MVHGGEPQEEGVARVELRQLEQAQPPSAPRVGDHHLPAAALREPLGEQVRFRHRGGHEHPGRNPQFPVVELAEKLGIKLGPVPVRQVLPVVLPPIHHLGAPHVEDLHRQPAVPVVAAEHVRIVLDAEHGLLLVSERLDRLEPVPQPRGIFEPQLGGRLVHVGFEAPPQIAVAAFQKQDRRVHRRPVLLAAAQGGHARTQAALDVVVQAAGPGCGPVDLLAAVADAERAPDRVDEQPRPGGGDVGAEITRAVTDRPAGQADLGKGGLERDPDEGKRLVVLQVEIVAGLVLVHQVALEDERLVFAAGDDVLDVAELRHQPGGLGIEVAGFLEVRPHPVPQVAGLADVDDLAPGVPVQVDARRVGQGSQLLVEGGAPFHETRSPPV